MLFDIEAFNLLLLSNTKSEDSLNDREYYYHSYYSPCCNCCKTEKLYTKLMETAAVEQTDYGIVVRCTGRCEKTGCDGTPDTVQAMHCDSTDGIIGSEHYFSPEQARGCYVD